MSREGHGMRFMIGVLFCEWLYTSKGIQADQSPAGPAQPGTDHR
jgi:hypothetical protein